ncbi:MAG: hypothetical protein WAW79_12295 [Steroidobacteraceae bacterium]
MRQFKKATGPVRLLGEVDMNAPHAWALPGMALLALLLSGCERVPTVDDAAPFAREAAGKALEKQFLAYDADALAALDTLGLLKFRNERRYMDVPVFEIALTEEGAALGLEVDWPAPDWPWGPSGAKAVTEPLCRLEFDKVTAVTPNEAGPLQAADVTYVKHTTGHSKLYGRLSESKPPLAGYCDPTLAEEGKLVLVKREAGWQTNRPPKWKGDWKINTSYEYDAYGRVSGAVTAITLGGELLDEDGDAIAEEGWSAMRPQRRENQAGGRRVVELVEAPFEVAGNVITFRPEIHDGRPAGGKLSRSARDPWQAGGLEICLAGASLSC